MAHYPFLLPATVVTPSLGSAGGGNFLGFWFENTSGEPIVITKLGRWQRAGNNQVHSLRVYEVTTDLGAATLLGSVDVNCSGATANAWLEGTLASPVTIALGVKFIIASEEFTGGDTYGSNGGTSFVTSGIGNTWSASVVGGIAYKGTDSNRGFGPVNFWYSSPEAIWTKSGTTYTTDGTRYSVQGAHDDAAPGDTIIVPEGATPTWGAGGAYLSLSKPITLTSPGAGATITIAADAPDWANGVIRNSGGAKIDNFTFQQIAGTGQNNSVLGCSGANDWRVTRCTYIGAAGNGYFVYFASYGLIDNCTIIGGAGNDEWIFGRGPNDAWQTASQKGTANAVFVEDCTLTGQGYLDANANASVVVRNCTITPTTGAIKLDGHGQYSNTPARSFRLMECYRNTWTTSNGSNPCFEIRGGTGFIWDNVSASGPIYVGDYRVVNGANTVSDYPLYDQVGTGQDPFPASAAGEPLYLWNNTRSSGGSNWAATQAIYGTSMVGLVNPDRDYFETDTSFDGTSGVGRGTRAQMDAITPTLTGVGFWVTDEGSWDTTLSANTSGRLYRWNGSAWVLYYTPYTYPHPLRGGVSAPAFTTQPESQTVNSGDDVTLTVTVTGTPTPELQWRWGGDDMPGETSTSLVLTNLTTGGVYDCVATNSEGTATSDPAVITVLSPSGSGTGNPLGNRGSIMLALGAF